MLDDFGPLVHEMENGQRVFAVFRDMRAACHAFDEARRFCREQGVQHAASRCNNRMIIRSSTGGSIRFTSERTQARGCACDVFYLGEGAALREWMSPLRAMAIQELGCGGNKRDYAMQARR